MSRGRGLRICMLVKNSVSHDGRVIREAESLARSGREVRVVGVRDAMDRRPENSLEHGAGVLRVDWRPRAFGLGGGFLIGAGFAPLFLALSGPGLALIGAVSPGADSGLDAFLRAWPLFPAKPLGFLLLILSGLLFFLGVRLCVRALRSADASNGGGASRPYAFFRSIPVLGQILFLFERYFANLAMDREMVEQARALEPDVIHCHDLNVLAAAVALKKRLGVPLVYDSHELYEELGALNRVQKLVYRFLQRRLAGSVDRLITVNPSIGRELKQRYPKLPQPVLVMNAAKITIDPDTTPYDGRLHQRAGLAPDRRILLYQGGLSRFRGLEVLVRSGPLLPPGWAVVLMGYGGLEPELRRLAAEADPSGDRVRFIPAARQKELPLWTMGAEIGVIAYENTSLNQWFCSPNKLWEYPAAGVPILASPFPEMERIVRARGIGWLLDDPAAPEGIAAIVARAGESELREKRRACREFIRKDNWSVYEAALLALYKGLEQTSSS